MIVKSEPNEGRVRKIVSHLFSTVCSRAALIEKLANQDLVNCWRTRFYVICGNIFSALPSHLRSGNSAAWPDLIATYGNVKRINSSYPRCQPEPLPLVFFFFRKAPGGPSPIRLVIAKIQDFNFIIKFNLLSFQHRSR